MRDCETKHYMCDRVLPCLKSALLQLIVGILCIVIGLIYILISLICIAMGLFGIGIGFICIIIGLLRIIRGQIFISNRPSLCYKIPLLDFT